MATAIRYDSGQQYRPGTHLIELPDGASERDIVFAGWPRWCVAQKISLADPVSNDTRDKIVPKLIEWERKEHFEFFTVSMPAAFEAKAADLPYLLLTANHAEEVTASEIRPGLHRIVLSHRRLDADIPFDPAKIRENPKHIYIGELSSGKDLIWDSSNPMTAHCLIIGQNGGGKTETMESIAVQLSMGGAQITMITPTEGDFRPFGRLHTVIAGLEVEHIIKATEAIVAWSDSFGFREREKNRKGHTVYAGRPWHLIVDELQEYLEIHEDDEPEVKEAKKVFKSRYKRGAKRGRKVACHIIAGTQTPNVDSTGGGDARSQFNFRIAVGKVPADYHAASFPPQDKNGVNPIVKKVLSNPATPPGRGVSIGGVLDPDDPFATVSEVMIQVAHMEKHQQSELLELPVPIWSELPDTTDVIEVGEVAPMIGDGDSDLPVPMSPWLEASLPGQPRADQPTAEELMKGDRLPVIVPLIIVLWVPFVAFILSRFI